MEEEKKDSKGLKVGIIIFLIICLIGIFYFMFKMTYVGDKKKDDDNSQDTAEPADQTQGEFTELTKYELKEGEEKKITIGEKKIIFRYNNSKLYWGDKELDIQGQTYHSIHITNKFILISYDYFQWGCKYAAYTLEGQKMEVINDENIRYTEPELSGGYLYIKGENIKYKRDEGAINLDNIDLGPCGLQGYFKTSIEKYQEIIKTHENDDIVSEYEIKQEDDKVIFKYLQGIYKVKDFINESKNLCVDEKK